MSTPRARRSELATPASSESMCASAARSGADLVFLDLEDACAPSQKEAARGIATRALTPQCRTVRRNERNTQWHMRIHLASTKAPVIAAREALAAFSE